METFKYTTTSRTILADLYTPVGVYMRLRDLYPQSALMESSDYHDSNNSRSFIGINPMASVAIGHGLANIIFPDGSNEQHEINNNYGSASAIHHSMPYVISRISTLRTRHRPRTMPPTCYTSFIR